EGGPARNVSRLLTGEAAFLGSPYHQNRRVVLAALVFFIDHAGNHRCRAIEEAGKLFQFPATGEPIRMQDHDFTWFAYIVERSNLIDLMTNDPIHGHKS